MRILQCLCLQNVTLNKHLHKRINSKFGMIILILIVRTTCTCSSDVFWILEPEWLIWYTLKIHSHGWSKMSHFSHIWYLYYSLIIHQHRFLNQWWATFLPPQAEKELWFLSRATPNTLHTIIHPFHFFPLWAWRAAQESVDCPPLP